MALRGDLASVDLAQVFQMLALNKKVGLLSIQSDTQRRVLYFDERGVTVHHNPHRILERVLASAVRTGRLDEASVEDVRDHSVRMGHSLGESLLAGGYLQQDELDELYQVELEEEVYDLFFCRDAKFEFHERATELDGWDGVLNERCFFNCDSVIMEAARRIDEWAYICERIPSTAEVLFAAVDLEEGEDYGVDGPAIHELLDGRRSVARVAELTGLTTFQVCKPLSQMLDAGVVEVVAVDDLVPLGDECLEDGRLEDAIALYERAVTAGVVDAGAHARAAQAYEAAEDFESANRFLAGANSNAEVVRQTEPSQVFEGAASGHIKLDSAHTQLSAATNEQFYNLPRDREVYLEFNYKCDVGFLVGLDVLGGSQAGRLPILGLNPTCDEEGLCEWKKMYLDLYPALSTMQDAAAFEIALNASIPADGSEGNIWLDNFKFVHFAD